MSATQTLGELVALLFCPTAQPAVCVAELLLPLGGKAAGKGAKAVLAGTARGNASSIHLQHTHVSETHVAVRGNHADRIHSA